MSNVHAYLLSGNRTDLNDVTCVMDALMAQGARLSEICEVYASR